LLRGHGDDDFKCADLSCKAPVQLRSYQTTNKMPAYFATSRTGVRHVHCCGGANLPNAAKCHSPTCEYYEDDMVREAPVPSGELSAARDVRSLRLPQWV